MLYFACEKKPNQNKNPKPLQKTTLKSKNVGKTRYKKKRGREKKTRFWKNGINF